METALFAKVQSQIQNTGILDHIRDTRMMLRRHEEILPSVPERIEAGNDTPH